MPRGTCWTRFAAAEWNQTKGPPVQRVLVIGYGNPYRGDDGFGPLTARQIEDRRLDSVEVIVNRQLTPEMAIPLSQTDYAIFLDAAVGDQPGALCAMPVEPCGSSSSSHHFEPGTLLALAQSVFGHAPPAALVTATAVTLEHGAEMSLAVCEAAARVAEAMTNLFKTDQLTVENLGRSICLTAAPKTPDD